MVIDPNAGNYSFMTGGYPNTTQSNVLDQYQGLLSTYAKPMQFTPTPAPDFQPVTYPTMKPYDTGRERSLTQQYLAPTLGRLDAEYANIISSARNKPFPAQAYLRSKAYGEYGKTLSSAYANALAPAHQQQMQEINAENQGLLGKYNADYINAMNKYNRDMNTWNMTNKARLEDEMSQRSGMLSLIRNTANQTIPQRTNTIVQRPPITFPTAGFADTATTYGGGLPALGATYTGSPDVGRESITNPIMAGWMSGGNEWDREANTRFGGV